MGGTGEIEEKLRRHIVPHIVRARSLHRSWVWYAGHFYLYMSDVIGALGSIGVAPHVIAILNRVKEGKEGGTLVWKEWFGDPWGVAGLVLLFAWAVLKIVATRHNLIVKCENIRGCQKQFQMADDDLPEILSEQLPIKALNSLQKEKINPARQRAIQEDVWPNGTLSATQLTEVDQIVAVFVQEYGGNWRIPADQELRETIINGGTF